MSILDGSDPQLSFGDVSAPPYFFEAIDPDGKSAGQFYNFLMADYREDHAESAAIKNVMSDSYTAFAMGAQPVRISITGMLPMTNTEDYRLDFHAMYNEIFRGVKLQEKNLVLRFYIKKTILTLKITGINMATTSAIDDMVQFGIEGIGAKYQVMPVS